MANLDHGGDACGAGRVSLKYSSYGAATPSVVAMVTSALSLLRR